jgi:hypothetical protein
MASDAEPRDDIVLPPRPIPPRDSDCCGSDCVLCVFTLYERELERWEAEVAALKTGTRRPAAR